MTKPILPIAVALQDYHWLRVQLIGCTDKDLRMELRQQFNAAEGRLNELRHRTATQTGRADYPTGASHDPFGGEEWRGIVPLQADPEVVEIS